MRRTLSFLPRIRRELKSGQLVPSGDMWPRFLFRNYEYNSADPWDGLLRSGLLVKVRHASLSPVHIPGLTTMYN
jgi:hypothetical protein